MGYRKLDERDIAYLKKVTEDGRVLTGSDISQDYSHDELGGVERAPEALVRVLSTGEVSDIMAYANREGIPVVTRGSGTGLVGAAVAIHGGIMLETTQMNRILELDRRNLTVTVEPGVLLMDLAQYVEENGLFYPPDPGEKSATIGGNISTNAGGMRAVKYGVTRDYVRALTVVLPTGEVVEFGGKTVKNSSGYSLLNLMIGSEGTLGVITRAVLKLVPLPGKTVSLLVPFADMEQAIREYCRTTGQPVPEQRGQIVRCIFESLALRYRQVLENLRALSPRPIETLHVIGGGSRNDLLNQFTANAIGIPVVAGPSEATAIGNVMIQAMTVGEATDVAGMRQLISRSIPLKTYHPQDMAAWDAAYIHFKNCVR